MAKPLPVRIPGDDCTVTVAGEVYHPHEGEWVEMIVGMTVGEQQSMERMRQLGVRLLSLSGDPDETAKVSALMDEHYEEITALLARRLVDWNWTDDLGRPLPKPDGTSGPLKRLRSEELYWLLTAGQGETPAQRKNDSRPSLTTSSALPSTETTPSTEGHNPTKAI